MRPYRPAIPRFPRRGRSRRDRLSTRERRGAHRNIEHGGALDVEDEREVSRSDPARGFPELRDDQRVLGRCRLLLRAKPSAVVTPVALIAKYKGLDEPPRVIALADLTL